MARVSVATDNFNRASLGANWTQSNVEDGSLTMSASTRVMGSHAQAPGSAQGARWAGSGSFTDNQYSEVVIAALGYQDINYHIGVAVRMSGQKTGPSTDTRSEYVAMVFADAGGPNYTTRLAKRVNGTYTQLHSANVAWTPGSDLLSIEAEGTTIRVCKNGTALGGSFTQTDASVTTGVPGVTGAGGSNVATADDWVGGNITAATVPTVTDAGDEGFYNGETSVVITGTNFGASQGSGTVKFSPSDNVADGGAVSQTVTAWGNTSITITVTKGSLSLDTNLYLFVTNNDAESNATGYVVQIQARPYIRENLINLGGAAVASEASIIMLVWRANPTTGAPNPNQALTVSTNGSGAIDQVIDRGSLAVGDPVWIALLKNGSPARGTLRKVTPVYE